MSAIKFLPTAKMRIVITLFNPGVLSGKVADWQKACEKAGLSDFFVTERADREPPSTNQEYCSSYPDSISLNEVVQALGFTPKELESLDEPQKVMLLKMALVFHHASRYKADLSRELKILQSASDHVGCQKIQEKLAAVNALLDSFQAEKSPKASLPDLYESVKKAAQTQRPVFEKSRDSTAMHFLKIILTVLSLGIAAGLGLWERSGDNLNKRLAKMTKEDNSPAPGN